VILIADQQKAIRLPVARIRRLAKAVLDGERVGDRSLSLAFVDNERIRDVNRRFLKHDFATDVLSFLLEDGIDRVFGELVISTEFAAGEAKKRRISVEQELLRYVAHGILHLLGYDDVTPAKKRAMWRRQEAYLRRSRGR
jgi:probable rRNA maturation factor